MWLTMSDRALGTWGFAGILATLVILLAGSDTLAIVNSILNARLGPLLFIGLFVLWAWCLMCALAVPIALVDRSLRAPVGESRRPRGSVVRPGSR